MHDCRLMCEKSCSSYYSNGNNASNINNTNNISGNRRSNSDNSSGSRSRNENIAESMIKISANETLM